MGRPAVTPSTDPEATAYLEELGTRLEENLGERLMCAAAIGSYAMGSYEPGRSDLDVIVIVSGPLTVSDWDAVVDTCSHEALPCPAKKLELVAYTRPQVASPRRAQRWELNLNTGRGVRHAGYDPMAESWHWFVLDLAVAKLHAVTLAGEPPSALIGDIADALIKDAHSANVQWHAVHQPDHRLMIAAARAAMWRDQRAWVSKREAWSWAEALTNKRLGKSPAPAPPGPPPGEARAKEQRSRGITTSLRPWK